MILVFGERKLGVLYVLNVMLSITNNLIVPYYVNEHDILTHRVFINAENQ